MTTTAQGGFGSRYHLISAIGHNALGTIWAAEGTRRERYAITIVDPAFATDPRFIARFAEERAVLTNIRHPNVAAVPEMVAEDQHLAIVTEFVEGHSLRALLGRGARPNAPEICRIGALAAAGLGALHAQQHAHGDLRPSTIWLENGREPAQVKLTGLGIDPLLRAVGAQPTEASSANGSVDTSPDYRAPEIIRGSTPDARSDLYSLGLVLLELGGGRLPAVAGTAPGSGQTDLVSAAPIIASCPALASTVRQLIDTDPQHRPESAAAVERSLGQLQDALIGGSAQASAATQQIPDAGAATAVLPASVPQPATGALPSPTPSHLPRTVLIISLVVVLLAVVAAAAFLLTDRGGTPSAPLSPAVTNSPAQGTIAPATSVAPTRSPTPTPTPSVDPRAQAEQQLEAARASSLQGIDLDGRWVLQLDSKYDGITDPRQTTASGSHTFGLVDIWADHQDLVTKMHSSGISKVLLLQATDFGVQTSLPGTTWVTLADPGNIADADAGNAECAQLFPNLSGDDLANSCVPRQLSAPHS